MRLLLAETGAGPPGKGVLMTPEMEALKARLKATWMAGDYGTFAKYLEPGALEFLERLPSKPAPACSMWPAARARYPSPPRAPALA